MKTYETNFEKVTFKEDESSRDKIYEMVRDWFFNGSGRFDRDSICASQYYDPTQLILDIAENVFQFKVEYKKLSDIPKGETGKCPFCEGRMLVDVCEDCDYDVLGGDQLSPPKDGCEYLTAKIVTTQTANVRMHVPIGWEPGHGGKRGDEVLWNEIMDIDPCVWDIEGAVFENIQREPYLGLKCHNEMTEIYIREEDLLEEAQR